jgi:hypothetical protein
MFELKLAIHIRRKRGYDRAARALPGVYECWCSAVSAVLGMGRTSGS